MTEKITNTHQRVRVSKLLQILEQILPIMIQKFMMKQWTMKMMKNYDGRWQSGPVEFCRWGCFWEQFQGKGAFSHVRQVLLLFWTKNYALIVSVV